MNEQQIKVQITKSRLYKVKRYWNREGKIIAQEIGIVFLFFLSLLLIEWCCDDCWW